MSDQSMTETELATVRTVLALVAERDALAVRVTELNHQHTEVVRKAYRRGYQAGRDAQLRGAPRISNPESNARGQLREMFRPSKVA